MSSHPITFTAFLASIIVIPHCVKSSHWDTWWTYLPVGIDGPAFWGRLNPGWPLCTNGHQQSPINVEPSTLLYDPNLKKLKIESTVIRGLLMNTGHDITLEVKKDKNHWINISEGPLSYNYRVSEIKFHLANRDSHGSEHTIDGHHFPVEMHVIAYNSDLYSNITEASKGTKGLAIIAVFLEISEETNKAFFFITKDLKWLTHEGRMCHIKDLSFSRILPKTTEYMTYEGSLTQPGCYETVTWMIMNKPVRISKEQLTAFRVMFNGQENVAEVPLENNSRDVKPLNNRVVRTNINGTRTASKLCSMQKDMYYKVNSRLIKPSP